MVGETLRQKDPNQMNPWREPVMGPPKGKPAVCKGGISQVKGQGAREELPLSFSFGCKMLDRVHIDYVTE